MSFVAGPKKRRGRAVKSPPPIRRREEGQDPRNAFSFFTNWVPTSIRRGRVNIKHSIVKETRESNGEIFLMRP